MRYSVYSVNYICIIIYVCTHIIDDKILNHLFFEIRKEFLLPKMYFKILTIQNLLSIIYIIKYYQ